MIENLDSFEEFALLMLLPLLLGVLGNLLTGGVRSLYVKTALGNPLKKAEKLQLRLEKNRILTQSLQELVYYTFSQLALIVFLGLSTIVSLNWYEINRNDIANAELSAQATAIISVMNTEILSNTNIQALAEYSSRSAVSLRWAVVFLVGYVIFGCMCIWVSVTFLVKVRNLRNFEQYCSKIEENIAILNSQTSET
mgnify:CR=1 FL=1